MSVRYLLQGNAGLEVRRIFLVGFHRSHEAPTLVLALQYLATGFEVGIEFRQLSPEIIDRTLEIAVGHEEMLLYIILLYLIASLTRQDNQFADHVRTTEVDTWVGLRVALLLGATNSLREGHIGSNLIEDEVQCTREDSLDLQNLITRVAQVVDGTDDRQTSTYVGLIAEPYTAVAGRLLQLQVAVVIA